MQQVLPDEVAPNGNLAGDKDHICFISSREPDEREIGACNLHGRFMRFTKDVQLVRPKDLYEKCDFLWINVMEESGRKYISFHMNELSRHFDFALVKSRLESCEEEWMAEFKNCAIHRRIDSVAYPDEFLRYCKYFKKIASPEGFVTRIVRKMTNAFRSTD